MMHSLTPRRPRRAHPRHALVLALLAALSLPGCGDTDDDRDQAAGAPEPSAAAPSPSPTPASGEQNPDASNGTPIRISSGDTELDGRLHSNATARDLAAQLPLTLTVRDHNSAEKTAPLPRGLSLDNAPPGHDPAAGDIGYWAPGGDFVLYYDNDAPYFDGIVRIGAFDGDTGSVEQLPDGARLTIERTG